MEAPPWRRSTELVDARPWRDRAMSARRFAVGVVAVGATLAAFSVHVEKVYVLDAVDGDQLQLQRGGLSQVRLIGIESPGHRSDKRHPAKLNLGQVAFGRLGEAQCDPWEKPKDKKQPMPPVLCRVKVDGIDLSSAQLDAGFARYSPRYAGSLSPDERESFLQKERAAREAKKGMWTDRG